MRGSSLVVRAFRTDDADADVGAATGMEDRIGENIEAVEINEDAGVAKP
jgi:hypothetical protein